jgi:restriction endonuclease S subunit
MSELQYVKFGDIAQQITTKVNPKNTSLNTYVGLEHLDSGSLQIKRRGTPQDVIGEKLRVCKGDIIFGKRRVYQRKLAIADFDGICSAHAMVLRPKEDVVDKDFFPFFMQSDLFMERALQISVGSLSPTINWKTLAVQEFTIPSLSDQHRIATTLRAAEDCIVKSERFIAAAERAKQVLMRELFSKGIGNQSIRTDQHLGLIPERWGLKKIGDCCKSSAYGPRFSCELYHDNGNVAVLRTTDLDIEGNISYSTMPKSTLPPEKFKEHYLKKDDLIISRSGTCGIAAIFSDFVIPVLPGAFLIRFRLNQSLDVMYLKYYLNSKFGQKRLKQLESGGVQKNLRGSSLLDFKIPFPPLPEQHQIAGILTRCDETIAAARANVGAAKALKMKMINELLSPEN